MRHLIEYIGATGVKTTDLQIVRSRWTHPRAGDVVDFSLMGGVYPYRQAFGTIEGIGTMMAREGEAHICCEPGSIFLVSPNSVSISGGPFDCVKLDRLAPTYSLRMQHMWNWGDHSAGADMAVYYHIMRPVFRLLPTDGGKQ